MSTVEAGRPIVADRAVRDVWVESLEVSIRTGQPPWLEVIFRRGNGGIMTFTTENGKIQLEANHYTLTPGRIREQIREAAHRLYAELEPELMEGVRITAFKLRSWPSRSGGEEAHAEIQFTFEGGKKTISRKGSHRQDSSLAELKAICYCYLDFLRDRQKEA